MDTPYEQLRSPRPARNVTEHVLQFHSHTVAPIIRTMLRIKALLTFRDTPA
jgi:hypothetical protein